MSNNLSNIVDLLRFTFKFKKYGFNYNDRVGGLLNTKLSVNVIFIAKSR